MVDLFCASKRFKEGVGGGGGPGGISVKWGVGVSKRGFQGKRVGFEPVEESGLTEDTGVGVLRSVNMGV